MKLTFNQKIIYGAIALGILFPIAAFLIALATLDLSFSLKSIAEMHNIMPTNYLIDLAPIILPIVAYYVTKMIGMKGESENELKQKEKFNKVEHFVGELGRGNYDIKSEFTESGDNIGLVLEDLKNSLVSNKTEEERRIWGSNGVAKFSEIVRDNNNGIDELSQKVIQELVKYIDARFGGFYFLDDSRKKHMLKLTGSYAYDFKVKEKQSFEIGESLVGQCFKDGETIILDNIPDEYSYSIESGLGESSPSIIIFVPLIANDISVGVIEIASFQKIEKHKIEFIEKLSESLAVSIQNVKTSSQTKDLLEESQFMSQQLQAQEEELRQNAEELQATQEEIERKLEDTEDLLKTEKEKINSIISTSSEGIIVVSDKGKLLDYNPAFQSLLGYTKTDFKNQKLQEILNLSENTIDFFNQNLEGHVELEIKDKKNTDIWVRLSISKIEIEGEITYSVFVSDISETKHSVAVMEESLTEFQGFMMEQAEIQGGIEEELEAAKKEIVELKK